MIIQRFDPHCHTEYSNLRLLDSINKPKRLIDRAIELGLSGIAITDHEALCGHVVANKYAQEIQKEYPHFKVALGNEIYLIEKRETKQKYYHFILIAKDSIGYKMLRILSSLAWMQSYSDRGMERVPSLKSELKNIIDLYGRGHLIATSACLGGELSTLTLGLCNAKDENEKFEYQNKINNYITYVKDLFADDFYIEVAPGCSQEQILVNQRLKSITKFYNLKMVIGTDAHFLKKEDRYVHSAYLNSQDGEREVDMFYEYAYLQDNSEIVNNLKCSNYSEEEIEEMFKNSADIYNKIQNYSLEHKQKIPQVDVPEYPKGKKYYTEIKWKTLNYLLNSDNKHERYWVNQCLENLIQKGLFNDDYLDRLEEEARVKKIIGEKLETNMYCYPITLQHYINLIWECGSTIGAGRGSSCSGLNHYLLGVTQLDPIIWKFPFFRYLNEERVELGSLLLILPSCK